MTRSGESNFFTIRPNEAVNLPDINLGAGSQIPEFLTVTPVTATMTRVGQTRPLTITARYPDGSTKDVTRGADGTNYTSSNPVIATVSEDGVVTAVSSGTVVIQAINDGTPAMIQVRVVFSTADSDGDGIPDDVETANGLNPNNPVDAEEDPDRDGLNNRDEIARGTDLRRTDTDGDGLKDGEEVHTHGTNPLLSDTDGDLISDSLEIRVGTNPLDPASVNFALVTRSARLFPPAFALTVNTIFPDAAVQLKLEARLIDDSVLDLTTRGNFVSSDLSICNFDATKGRVRAGSNGSCTVTGSFGGLTGSATGTVESFAPRNVSVLALPAPGMNVDVSGDFAYVAASSAGLVVVNAGDRTRPAIVATHPSGGSANDVKVRGGFAYVASGAAGLRIVNVASPAAPVAVGAYDSPGDAQDVAVYGDLAFIADGASGLAIVNVAAKNAPVRRGGLVLAGGGQGVDYDPVRRIAVVAMGTAGLAIVNASNPAAPTMLATLPGGDVRDVVIKGTYAILSDVARSLTSVDIGDPANPKISSSTRADLGGAPVDFAYWGDVGITADNSFGAVVPLIAIADPAFPGVPMFLPMSPPAFGSGVAVEDGFMYSTVGSSLRIAQYALPQPVYVDDPLGKPPTLTITSPKNGFDYPQGLVTVEATATDDVGVAEVRFYADGRLALTDKTPPYSAGVPALRTGPNVIDVEAVDYGGNSTRKSVAINVIGGAGTETGIVFSVLNQIPPTDDTRTPIDVSRVFSVLNKSAPFVTIPGPVEISRVFSLLNKSAPFIATPGPVEVSRVFSVLNRRHPTLGIPLLMELNRIFSVKNGPAGPAPASAPVSQLSWAAIRESLNSADANNNGLPDALEALFDAVTADPDGDADGDGLTNLEEWNRGTNPFDPDTDRDGLNDFQERELGTDPLNPDSDFDTYWDGDEVLGGGDPLSAARIPKIPPSPAEHYLFGPSFTIRNTAQSVSGAKP